MRAFTHQVMIFQHNGQRIIQVTVQAWTIISGFSLRTCVAFTIANAIPVSFVENGLILSHQSLKLLLCLECRYQHHNYREKNTSRVIHTVLHSASAALSLKSRRAILKFFLQCKCKLVTYFCRNILNVRQSIISLS